jgi:hypothetical protein
MIDWLWASPEDDDDETVTPHFNEDFESDCYGVDDED